MTARIPISKATHPLCIQPAGWRKEALAPSRIRRLQLQAGTEPCFRSEKRYTCQGDDCDFARECRRRVASWKS